MKGEIERHNRELALLFAMARLIDWCKELLADDTVDLTASARAELTRLIRDCENGGAQ